MDLWTAAVASDKVLDFDKLHVNGQQHLIECLNDRFPPAVYEEHVRRRRNALNNLAAGRSMLDGAELAYPVCLPSDEITGRANDLEGYGIMLTAGGEGERLRLSLLEHGIPESDLQDFTKATFPLPGFPEGFGTLHVNLALCRHLCRESGLDIPVIVSTGPEHSVTARVIPSILEKQDYLGLRNLHIIAQDERLHLTLEEQIAYTFEHGKDQPTPITNPDETGGPVMKLKRVEPGSTKNTLDWLGALGCTKIILLQATALYGPGLVLHLAAAGKTHDGLGIGIARSDFPPEDPYGTYVLLSREVGAGLVIAEQAVRNDATRRLTDPATGNYLPLNTGLYVFDCDLIRKSDLPDYASPPKEVLPGQPRSPKIGYAATDILPLAHNPAVLTVPKDSYAVLKNIEDLARLSEAGKRLGLARLCTEAPGR